MQAKTRCAWAGSDPRMIAYHDDEWGVPVHDDRVAVRVPDARGRAGRLVAGRRSSTSATDTARRSRGFDPARVARFDRAPHRGADERIRGIVRNRLKIESTVEQRAGVRSTCRREFGSFDRFVWDLRRRHADRVNRWRAHRPGAGIARPSPTPCPRRCKQRGFRFVGTTICYAFMQATGMVNDHLVTCFRHRAVLARRTTLKRCALHALTCAPRESRRRHPMCRRVPHAELQRRKAAVQRIVAHQRLVRAFARRRRRHRARRCGRR